jgi:RecB family exonuclease
MRRCNVPLNYGYAEAVLGPVEIHGHSELSPCWRPLLEPLSKAVKVTWVAGPRHIPVWLQAMPVEIRRSAANEAEPILFSCANPQHEVIEAFRWMRELLAKGTARPEEIAIAAASPADFDDHVLALSRDASIPVHFVHGTKAVAGYDGQVAAALAEVIVKGLSQERMRRLFSLIRTHSPALRDIPRGWTRLLPPDAPLTTVERWEQIFNSNNAGDWPDGVDRSAIILEIIRLLAKGPDAAVEAGEKLLSGVPLALWRRALDDGPPQALPVTLSHLRRSDGLEPATNVIFASAMALASAPRPYVRLLALNAGRWPRRISEDRLIPDHVIPIEKLDPLPISDADWRDFRTIVAPAKSVAISYSRRDVEGRLLGRSPIVAKLKDFYLARARIPEHAASESDRLLARPNEFDAMPIAISGRSCWSNWYRNGLTPHDGLARPNHPRLKKLFETPLSASSLTLLLRDPIRFVWRHGLRWRQPGEIDEPLTLDPLSFGLLVHAVLRHAVEALESGNSLAKATRTELDKEVGRALEEVAGEWEREQPVPPPIIWRSALKRARQTALAALSYPLDCLKGQKSWTEIPFGFGSETGRQDMPWDTACPVEIPGTGIRLQGYIDRLDLAGDRKRARVIDYKTGRLNGSMASAVLKGGRELQRCLYAFAVKTLLGSKLEIEAALLYPGAPEGKQGLFPLPDVDAVLARLATAIKLSRTNIEAGLAIPGIDADNDYNDLAFALPASQSYLTRKMPLTQERLGKAANVWDEP